jgi:glutaminase
VDAFTIGLPAKSGVSGAVMLVIPGLTGISTTYAP